MHSAVHRAVGLAVPDVPVAPQTRPDAWTPHITLARRIDADLLGEALDVLDVAALPCRIVGARLWDSLEKTVTPLT
ncbi:MAG TPA: hypothetical protein VN759_04970, partial [Pseudolysinimonas sp.]|nr:hypothetical protein [Pseudolysinimonas sp.]